MEVERLGLHHYLFVRLGDSASHNSIFLSRQISQPASQPAVFSSHAKSASHPSSQPAEQAVNFPCLLASKKISGNAATTTGGPGDAAQTRVNLGRPTTLSIFRPARQAHHVSSFFRLPTPEGVDAAPDAAPPRRQQGRVPQGDRAQPPRARAEVQREEDGLPQVSP